MAKCRRDTHLMLQVEFYAFFTFYDFLFLATQLILRGPSDQAVIIGSTVQMPCEVSSSLQTSTASFKRQWFHRDQLIHSSRQMNIE